MLTGVAVTLLGVVLSYPVFIGQYGLGVSWLPAMIFVGNQKSAALFDLVQGAGGGAGQQVKEGSR